MSTSSTVVKPLEPKALTARQQAFLALTVAASAAVKDPSQLDAIFRMIGSAAQFIVPWLDQIEALLKTPEGVNLCFDLRRALFHVINAHNPTPELPESVKPIFELCRLIQASRRPAHAVPPPITAQSTPAIEPAAKADEPAAASKAKPRPKPTKAFKSKATIDSEDEVRIRRFFKSFLRDLTIGMQDMSVDEPVVVAEDASVPKASSSKSADDAAKKSEVIMIEYDDVPGMDSAAASKANQKIKGGTSSGNKKARMDSPTPTPSQGFSLSAAAVERAILKLEEEHADLDFRVAYSTQQLDLVNLELDRQRKKLASLTGASSGKGKGKAKN